MSFAAKTTFTLCCSVSIGIIVYVHYNQESQRKQLHLGVERDIQRQEQRKIQNLYMLEQQKLLTKELREANKLENYETPA
ncbi:protein PET117 homolog, mitochondrial [Ceratina calcarata]|uniref:Protein PET117 homolog, mitochondrial n=1 Tax=Ceratina calcarata TaxID=156304 RepID=A0AAJ7J167_9HYME|nr:protein PET117 homolog, mitochondrial [Ceratina calcarata]